MKINFSKIFIIQAIIISNNFLFTNLLIYSQIDTTKISRMIAEKSKFGEIIELKMNEKVHFEDSLSVVLTSFSHKRPYKGDSTKATAYLTLSKGFLSEEIMLSVYGVDGKSKSEDGLSDTERYDSLSWKQYEFLLKNFIYNTSIEIIVYKRKSKDD